MRKNSHIDVANNVTENEEKHRLHGRLMACRQRRQSGRWAQLVSVTSWSGPAAGGPRHQPPYPAQQTRCSGPGAVGGTPGGPHVRPPGSRAFLCGAVGGTRCCFLSAILVRVSWGRF